MIGTWQLVLIFAIVLVLFGAGRIPKIMRDIGAGIRSFKEGFDGENLIDNLNTDSKKRKPRENHLSNGVKKKRQTRRNNNNFNKVKKG